MGLRLVAGLTLRDRERHPLVRAGAVPVGSRRATDQVVWLAAVRAHPDLAGLRADTWTSVWAVAEQLAWHADWRTMLSRPTHAVLAERARVSVRTVARVRARLQAAGLLGIVTPGVTRDLVDPDAGPLAQAYVLAVPSGLQLVPAVLHDEPVSDGSPTDDRPVSVHPGPARTDDGPVTAPAADDTQQSPTQPPAPRSQPVDEHVTPSQPTFGGLVKETPARTRARKMSESPARSARGPVVDGPSRTTPGRLELVETSERALDERGPQDHGSAAIPRWRRPLGDDVAGDPARPVGPASSPGARRRARLDELDAAAAGRSVLWPAGRRPVDRGERLAAAAEARRIDPVLRRASVAAVAALCRDWHLAGWTLTDVRTALQTAPDGSPWPHTLTDPAHDVRHVTGWVRHRLAAWRTTPGDPTSPPAPSPSQRATAAAEADRAEHARLTAEHVATAAASVPAAAAVPGWAALRAQRAARAATIRDHVRATHRTP